MRRILFSLILTLISAVIYCQQQLITVGMNGAQVRAAINNNFDTVFHGNMRYGIEIGSALHDNRIDSGRVDGAALRLYHGATLLNTGGTTLNVKDYGAKGDGIVDDRTAIINTFNAALASNGTVYFPDGTFYCSSSVTVDYSSKKIGIVATGGATILGTSSLTSLIFQTTLSATTTFSSNPTKGSQSLALTDATGIATDDILEIRSTDEYCNIGISGVFKGELCTVQKVSGNTVYINNVLYDDYDKNTTTIRKVNSGKLNIDGLNFKNMVLDVRYIRNSVIQNCRFIMDGFQPFVIADAYDLLVDHIKLNRGQGYIAQGIYALSVASSQNVTVNGCLVDSYAQGLLCGGEHHPTRNYVCSNNYVINVTNGIDTHAQVEYATVEGNILMGAGIYCKGSFINIKSNTIVGGYIKREREDLADVVHNVIFTGYENIVDNKIFNLTDTAYTTAAYGTGINVSFAEYRDTIDHINVSGNYVKTYGYAFLLSSGASSANFVKYIDIDNNYFYTASRKTYAQQPTIYSNCNLSFGQMLIHHNTIINKGTTGTVAAVFLSNNGSFTSISFDNNVVDGKTCYLVATPNCDVSNNIFYSTTLLPRCEGGYIKVLNNIFKGTAPQLWDIQLAVAVNPPLDVLVRGNVYETGSLRGVSADAGAFAVMFRDESKHYAGALTDGSPTAAEVNAIVGEVPSHLGAGYKAVIKDTTGSGLTYTFLSDGLSWIMQGVPSAI